MSKTYLGAKRKRTNTPAENRKRTVEYRHLRYAKTPAVRDEEETVIVLSEFPRADVVDEAEEAVVVLPETEEPVGEKPVVTVSEPVKESTEKGGFFAKITAFFAGLFGTKLLTDTDVDDENVRAAELLEVPSDSEEPEAEEVLSKTAEEPAAEADTAVPAETAETEPEAEEASEAAETETTEDTETETSEKETVTSEEEETAEETETTEAESSEETEESEEAETSEEPAEEAEASEETAESEEKAEESESSEEVEVSESTEEETDAAEETEEPEAAEKAAVVTEETEDTAEAVTESPEETETSEEKEETESETSEEKEVTESSEEKKEKTEASEETTEESEKSEEETESETSEEKEVIESSEEKKEKTEASEETTEESEKMEEETTSETSEEKEETESSEEKKEETETSEETEKVTEEAEKTDEEKETETAEEKTEETTESETEEKKEEPSEPEKPKKSLAERFLEFKAYRRRKKLENLDEMIDRPTANILQMMVAPGTAMERVSKAGYATVSRFTILAFNILKWIIFGAFFGSALRMIITSVEFSIVQMNFSSASGIAVKIALFTLAAEYLSYYLISIVSGLMRKQITMPVLIDVTGRSSLSSALIFLVACFVLKHNMALGFAILIAGLVYEIAMKTYGIGLVSEDISRNIQFWFIALLVVLIAMLSFTYFRMTMSNVVEIFSKIMNLN